MAASSTTTTGDKPTAETFSVPPAAVDLDAKPAPTAPSDEMHHTIREVVSNVAANVVKNLRELRQRIDQLESMVITDAEAVMAALAGHAKLCGSVQQEINRLAVTVEEIRAEQISPAKLKPDYGKRQ